MFKNNCTHSRMGMMLDAGTVLYHLEFKKNVKQKLLLCKDGDDAGTVLYHLKRPNSFENTFYILTNSMWTPLWRWFSLV